MKRSGEGARAGPRWVACFGAMAGAGLALAGRLRARSRRARSRPAEAPLAARLAALRESEARYRAVSELTSDFAYITALGPDGTARIIWMSGSVERVTGYTSDEMARSGKLVEIAHPDDVPSLRENQDAVASGETTEIEYRIIAKDGRLRWLRLQSRPEWDSEHGRVTQVCAAARDITRQKQVEAELRQAQKLESVGQLAAGIAHEINTPIQFVGDNARFLQESLPQLLDAVSLYRPLREVLEEGQPVGSEALAQLTALEEASDVDYLETELPKALRETLEGVQRVATIVRALKEFAHPDSAEQSPADLNRALLSTLTVARGELESVAEVVTELEPLPPVRCHIGELNQVFLNLLINAAHAVADARRDGLGRIAVRTWRDGDLARVSIRDSGCGIPEAIRPRIFDPFFTTKEVGRGTGQGLALARAVVVDKHRGTIEFETEVGVGTTFVIGLPIAGRTWP